MKIFVGIYMSKSKMKSLVITIGNYPDVVGKYSIFGLVSPAWVTGSLSRNPRCHHHLPRPLPRRRLSGPPGSRTAARKAVAGPPSPLVRRVGAGAAARARSGGHPAQAVPAAAGGGAARSSGALAGSGGCTEGALLFGGGGRLSSGGNDGGSEW
jgi:hypothetical protein